MFAYGEKYHPFCAALIGLFQYDLDIELMKAGAALFQGRHNFVKYCTKPRNQAPHLKEKIMASENYRKYDLYGQFFSTQKLLLLPPVQKDSCGIRFRSVDIWGNY